MFVPYTQTHKTGPRQNVCINVAGRGARRMDVGIIDMFLRTRNRCIHPCRSYLLLQIVQTSSQIALPLRVHDGNIPCDWRSAADVRRPARIRFGQSGHGDQLPVLYTRHIRPVVTHSQRRWPCHQSVHRFGGDIGANNRIRRLAMAGKSSSAVGDTDRRGVDIVRVVGELRVRPESGWLCARHGPRQGRITHHTILQLHFLVIVEDHTDCCLANGRDVVSR